MSLPSRRKLWSVLTYDLKTAVDVCGLPSLLKTPSRVTSHYTLLPLATKVKIETELVIYAAHIRVIDYADPDWIIQKKGRGYYDHRSQFLDCELLVPLSYPGLVRLYHSKKTRTYVNISEASIFSEYLHHVSDPVYWVYWVRDHVCSMSGLNIVVSTLHNHRNSDYLLQCL